MGNTVLSVWKDPSMYWVGIQVGTALAIFGRGAALSGCSKLGNISSGIGTVGILLSTAMLLVSNAKLTLG